MQLYGPRHESRTLPWAKCQIFLETLFICNDIDKKGGGQNLERRNVERPIC